MFPFFKILFQIAQQIVVNYFFYRKNLKKKFSIALQKSDGTLTVKDIRRMKFFSVFIPIMLGYGFGLIRGKKMNSQERLLMMSFSGATPIFDDFFDDKNLKVGNLEKIFLEKENYQPQNSKEKIFIEILLFIKPKIHQPEKFIDLCYDIFKAQKEALKQVSSNEIEFSELKKISFAKCSASAILFWSLLKNDFTEQEKTLVMQVGNLIQYTDDIFDLWFDLQDVTQTLATNATSIIALENDFKTEWQKLQNAVNQLPVADLHKQKFLTLQWFFFSRTFVAMEQLKKLTPNNEAFISKNFSRKQLVCDMEKWNNNIKWVKYFNQHRH